MTSIHPHLRDAFVSWLAKTPARLWIERWIGRIGYRLLPLFPERANRIKREEFTLVNTGHRSVLDWVLRTAIGHRMAAKNEFHRLSACHMDFWSGEKAKTYHNQRRKDSDDADLSFHSRIMEELTDISLNLPEFRTLCEIGTGSGRFLERLGTRFTHFDRFIGIDLNPETVLENQKRRTNQKIRFISGDADAWIRENGGPFWIYLTHRGVLEYFHEEKLQDLLDFIGNILSPAIFMAVEPVGEHHDLSTERNSQIYGKEFSFSHNYPFLFSKAGFDIRNFEMMDYSGQRFCTIMASRGIPTHRK